ncbi:unnamed protein product [Linum tenue]|uniref:Uncharacterized protein n=1 Tax=Linum tenue TaxID=586396 RepID=A0AAV0L8U3_9ROSI|nr:unnamed protein product [Linum tenue]
MTGNHQLGNLKTTAKKLVLKSWKVSNYPFLDLSLKISKALRTLAL